MNCHVSTPGLKFNGRAALALCAALVAVPFRGIPAEPPSPTETTGASNDVPQLPPVTVLRSPLKFFRELLASSPMERERQLAARSPESRKVITEKLQEYEALSADERELRLRTTELYSYLKDLRDLQTPQRALLLTNVPTTDRQLLEARLDYWDKLPGDQQRRLRENEMALKYLAQIRSGERDSSGGLGQGLAEDLDRFRRLGAPEREKVMEQFKRLFELDENERDKVLDRRDGPDRAELERALNELQKIPAEKKAAYVDAVSKFTTMSHADRAEFLKGAERWKRLSVEERAAWRALFMQSPPLPPLPPGADSSSLPPLPPDGAPPLPPLQATNSPTRPNTKA
jgi:hypothetical protein